MLSKVALIISKAVFTLIDRFLNSPKVNNIFGLLLRVNLLPRTLKNCTFWSHWLGLKPFLLFKPYSLPIGYYGVINAYAALLTDFIPVHTEDTGLGSKPSPPSRWACNWGRARSLFRPYWPPETQQEQDKNLINDATMIVNFEAGFVITGKIPKTYFDKGW